MRISDGSSDVCSSDLLEHCTLDWVPEGALAWKGNWDGKVPSAPRPGPGPNGKRPGAPPIAIRRPSRPLSRSPEGQDERSAHAELLISMPTGIAPIFGDRKRVVGGTVGAVSVRIGGHS